MPDLRHLVVADFRAFFAAALRGAAVIVYFWFVSKHMWADYSPFLTSTTSHKTW